MSVPALPSPIVPLTSQDNRVTTPWFGYFKGADATWRPSLQTITTASTVSQVIPNYGVTIIKSVPTSTHTLAAPEPGVEKTIIVENATTACKVTSASTAISINSSGWVLSFTSSGTYKVATLVGISTSEWVFKNTQGTVSAATA